MLCECLRKRKHQSVASPMSVWLSHYLCGPNKHRIIFVGVVTQINLCPSATPKKWLVCPIFYGVPQRPSTKTAPIPTPLRHKEIDKKKKKRRKSLLFGQKLICIGGQRHICVTGESDWFCPGNHQSKSHVKHQAKWRSNNEAKSAERFGRKTVGWLRQCL